MLCINLSRYMRGGDVRKLNSKCWGNWNFAWIAQEPLDFLERSDLKSNRDEDAAFIRHCFWGNSWGHQLMDDVPAGNVIVGELFRSFNGPLDTSSGLIVSEQLANRARPPWQVAHLPSLSQSQSSKHHSSQSQSATNRSNQRRNGPSGTCWGWSQ